MYKRTILKQIENSIEHFPVTILSGPRQVGKSTELYHHIRSLGYTYITLDNRAELMTAKNDPELFLKNHPAPLIIDAYGIIGLNSKDSAIKGFLKLSPILFSLQKRLKVDLRRKHAQNEDLSAKRGVACNGGSTVSDVVPSHLLQRQSVEHTPDVDLYRITVRYPKDVSLACAA